ncbi:hypothetical protein [Leptospira santarosai]
MLYGDFVLDISFLQTILFALFAILTLFRDDYVTFFFWDKFFIDPNMSF